MGDNIQKLPIDKNQKEDNESLQNLKRLLGPEKVENINLICNKNMDIIIAGAIFFGVNLPIVEGFIKKFYCNAENPYIMTIVKTIIFIILFFMVNNFYLAKN